MKSRDEDRDNHTRQESIRGRNKISQGTGEKGFLSGIERPCSHRLNTRKRTCNPGRTGW